VRYRPGPSLTHATSLLWLGVRKILPRWTGKKGAGREEVPDLDSSSLVQLSREREKEDKAGRNLFSADCGMAILVFSWVGP
jgi:hypothetical protein